MRENNFRIGDVTIKLRDILYKFRSRCEIKGCYYNLLGGYDKLKDICINLVGVNSRVEECCYKLGKSRCIIRNVICHLDRGCDKLG